MKVVIGPEARDDLDSIRQWIARDDRARAISFVLELVDAIEALDERWKQFPEIGRRGGFPVRRMNYRRYRVFYTVDADCVNVLHVHQGGRETPDFSS